MRWWIAAVLAAAAACGGRKEPAPKVAKDATAVAPPVADGGDVVCEKLAWIETIAIPEASGSGLLDVDGAPGLIVVGDSGNKGGYVIVDPETGAERERGKLPLGTSKSDDVEGLAVRDGALVGLTSSGFVLAWVRTSKAFALADGPYPLADASTGLACDEREVNCGKNYEGICLRSGAVPDGECVGLAASKADGALYCLVADGARVAATARSIAVTQPGTLTGCDIAADGSVWAGSNLFDASRVFRVTGWTAPETAKVVEIGSLAVGFPESIANGAGGTVYRFSDVPDGGPSLVGKFRCSDAGR
jgi:hypothetical protein